MLSILPVNLSAYERYFIVSNLSKIWDTNSFISYTNVLNNCNTLTCENIHEFIQAISS